MFYKYYFLYDCNPVLGQVVRRNVHKLSTEFEKSGSPEIAALFFKA